MAEYAKDFALKCLHYIGNLLPIALNVVPIGATSQCLKQTPHCCICLQQLTFLASINLYVNTCCAEYNVAVFITNQMTADPGGMFTVVER